MIDDLERIIISVVGTNKLGNIIAFILSLLKVAMADLLVMMFFASQELMDSSSVQIMNMKPLYEPSGIGLSILLSKLIMHTVLILLVSQISARMFNVYEGHAIGVCVIFFICAYEFMFNVLFNLASILGLKSLNKPDTYFG